MPSATKQAVLLLLYYYALIGAVLGNIPLPIPFARARIVPAVGWSWVALLLSLILAGQIVGNATRAHSVGKLLSRLSTTCEQLWSGLKNPLLPSAILLMFLCVAINGGTVGYVFSSDLALQATWSSLALLLFAAVARWGGRGVTLSAASISWIPLAVLVVFQLLLCWHFIAYAQGRLIFSDDHPSFLYRLALIQQHLPDLLFYATDWNGGRIPAELFVTGAVNLYLVFSPLLLLSGANLSSMDVASVYSYIIPLLGALIGPLCVYAAARVLELSRRAALIAALLSFAPSITFFEWLLKYGALGFVLSAVSLPLFIVLLIRKASADSRPDRFSNSFGSVVWCVALATVSFMAFAWPPAVVAAVPALAYVGRAIIASEHRVGVSSGDRFKFATLVAGLILTVSVNLPVAIGVTQAFDIKGFLSSGVIKRTIKQGNEGTTILETNNKTVKETSASEQTRKRRRPGFMERLKKAVKQVRSSLAKSNPILWILAALGMLGIAKPYRMVFGATAIWLLMIAAVGGAWFPQLELSRLIVALGFLLTIPAGAAVERLCECGVFDSSAKGIAQRTKPLVALTPLPALAFVILAPLTAYKAYENRSPEHFIFAPHEAAELARAIATHGGEGRTIFSSFVLHELGSDSLAAQNGGHIAPLALWSGKQLFASHYAHKHWKSLDPIPREFTDKGDLGIEEFFDLINVTAVVTHRREWARYCQSNPKYQEVFFGGRFRLFKRRPVANGYFAQGAGSVQVVDGGIEVVPESDFVVVKYLWVEGLSARVVGAEAPSAEQVKVELFPSFAYNENQPGGGVTPVYFVGLRISTNNVSNHSLRIVVDLR